MTPLQCIGGPADGEMRRIPRMRMMSCIVGGLLAMPTVVSAAPVALWFIATSGSELPASAVSSACWRLMGQTGDQTLDALIRGICPSAVAHARAAAVAFRREMALVPRQ
jgi:hypothetical protein